MKNLLRADLFALRRSRTLPILFLGAVAFGAFMPLLFYAILKFMEIVSSNATLLEVEELKSMLDAVSGVTKQLTAENVFLMVLPMSEGYGLVISGIVCHYCARQFSNGVIRNKIISGSRRRDIFFSMAISSLLLAFPAGIIYAAGAAGVSALFFGKFVMDGWKIVTVIAVSSCIYIAYAGIQTFTAFTCKSAPLSIVICILLPIATNTVFSILGAVISSLPEEIIPFCGIFPSFQSILMINQIASPAFLIISVCADIVWFFAFVLAGARIFSRADVK